MKEIIGDYSGFMTKLYRLGEEGSLAVYDLPDTNCRIYHNLITDEHYYEIPGSGSRYYMLISREPFK